MDCTPKLFHLEMHPETGQHRVVRYTPDPDTMQPVRDQEGPWKDPVDPVDPVAKMAEIQRLWVERRAREAAARTPHGSD